MDFEFIMEQAGIPLLACVVCLYYGFRLMLTHDSTLVRGKDKPHIEDEKAYSEAGGRLIIGLGIAMLGMAVILFFSVVLAFIEVCAFVVLFALLWKRVNDKYDSKGEEGR